MGGKRGIRINLSGGWIWKRGEITVFVSLMLAALLFFFQAALRSAGYAMLRSQMQEALELAEYSALSEYHRELLEDYGLFYLDLSYGGGAEETEYLNQRLVGFIDANLPSGKTVGLDTWDYSRATDSRGTAYYEQAASYMKQKTGAALVQKLKEYEEYAGQASDSEEGYEEAEVRENQNLEELKKRREEEEEKSTPDPVASTNELKQGSILHLVVKEPGKLSGKKADLSVAPSVRSLLSGAGPRGRNEPGVGNDVFFLAYLLEHFPDAVEYLTEERESGRWLDYQLEYLIAGKDTDIANLEAVCGRLLAIREGMNYLYLLSDSAKVAECAALAAALVGATLIPGLVEAMKQVLLLAWAFAESILDVRMLLNGKRTVFYKDSSTWKLSLSAVLEPGSLSEFDEREDSSGLLYQDYLGILLTLTGRENKVMRSLDAIEGVIREKSGGQWFYIDQCADSFWLRAVCTNGQELTAERWIGYEW